MEEFSHLFNPDEINEILENKHRDPVTKEIGDRVTILEFTSVTHLDGTELDPDNEMNFGTSFIVIETRQNYHYDAHFKTYRQDLVVVNLLTTRRFRVNSGHVKIK